MTFIIQPMEWHVIFSDKLVKKTPPRVYEGCSISNVYCSRHDNALYDLAIDEPVE